MQLEKRILTKWVYNFLLKVPYIGTYLKFRTIPSVNKSLVSYLRFWLKRDKTIYWPRDSNNLISYPKKIKIGYNSNIGARGGYLQGAGNLIIGNYVVISFNVGVLSANHAKIEQNHYDKKTTTVIGDYCWIGMNAVILPGVVLGERTIVGAGSVVTKSFPEGYCVIAGNPAKVISFIDKSEFVKHEYPYKFYGYVPDYKFEKFSKKYLGE